MVSATRVDETKPSVDGKQPRLLTTAAAVLTAILEEPGLTIREMARRCGKTERAVWQLVNQLEHAGLVQRQRRGRRNHYSVDLLAVARQLADEGMLLFSLITQRHNDHHDGPQDSPPFSLALPAMEPRIA